jgi:hypothetical protein
LLLLLLLLLVMLLLLLHRRCSRSHCRRSSSLLLLLQLLLLLDLLLLHRLLLHMLPPNCSRSLLGLRRRHRVQDLVAELQGAVQVDLDPAWSLLNRPPRRVVLAPSLYKRQAEDAQATEVVHADADGAGSGGRDGGRDVAVFVDVVTVITAVSGAGYCCGLCGRCGLGGSALHAHLLKALAKIEYLKESKI